jgi:predicted transcriptional regulator
MSAKELKAFLSKSGFRPEDIAAATGLGTSTVYRFLRGEGHSRVTERLIAEFVASKTLVSPPEPKRSTA